MEVRAVEQVDDAGRPKVTEMRAPCSKTSTDVLACGVMRAGAMAVVGEGTGGSRRHCGVTLTFRASGPGKAAEKRS